MNRSNKKAPSVHSAQGFGYKTNDPHHIAPGHGSQQKRLATLQAALAFYGGYTLHELVEGGFHVCRWAGFYHCAGLGALEAFARNMGAVCA